MSESLEALIGAIEVAEAAGDFDLAEELALHGQETVAGLRCPQRRRERLRPWLAAGAFEVHETALGSLADLEALRDTAEAAYLADCSSENAARLFQALDAVCEVMS